MWKSDVCGGVILKRAMRDAPDGGVNYLSIPRVSLNGQLGLGVRTNLRAVWSCSASGR